MCGMCKKRIEDAAFIKGVKFAEWDKKTGMLTVVYKSDKTTEDDIHKSLAKVGHATEKVDADEKSYDALPDCCKYKDGLEVH